MKRYRAIELILTANNIEPPEGGDFGKQAAIAHRIDKGSWEGAKTKAQGFKNLLGQGGFKKVFDVPVPGAHPKPVDFVLAKLILQQDTEDRTRDRVQLTLKEVVGMMYMFGIPRMTVWISGVDKEHSAEHHGVRMALYLPRIKGDELYKRLAGNPHAIDLNLRIRWFNQVFAQIKTLHYARLYMGDIKPQNIMVDDALGASVIDFGGLTRPWRWPTAATRLYSLNATLPEVHAKLLQYWMTSVGTPMDSITSGFISTQLKPNANTVASTLAARPEGAKAEYSPFNHRGYNMALYGIHHDTFSLAVTALAMGLVNTGNMHHIKQLLTTMAPRPYHMQQFVDALRASYTGDPALLDKPSQFNPLVAVNGIVVRAAADSTLDPESLTSQMIQTEIREADRDFRDGTITVEEKDARTQALNAFEDAMKIFRVLSSVTSVYQVPGGVGGKSSVDSKHMAMTALINQLTWTTSYDQLRDTLTRVFAASLVNRSIVTKEVTKSFEALVAAVRGGDIMIIMQRVWSPQFNNGTPLPILRQLVINKALLLDGSIGDQGAFKKSHLNERLMRLLDTSVAAAPPQPATRAQVLGAIDQMLGASKNTVGAGPLRNIADIRLAGQANRPANMSAAEIAENDRWAVIAGVEAERSFDKVVGHESPASITAYNSAVDQLYTHP